MCADRSKSLKVFILSNCQAASLGMAWKAMRPEDKVDYAEVHLLLGQEQKQTDVLRKILSADVLLHAPISENYDVVFARSSNIKKLAIPQRLMIPTIFFDGLHPDMMYIGDSLSRVSSAIGPQNSRIVLQSFLLGFDEEQAIHRMTSPDMYEVLGYFDAWNRSLSEFYRRDSHCDISVADLMIEGYRSAHQLYTLNHPMNNLIVSMIKRIFGKMSLDYLDIDENFVPATLVLGPVWPVFDFLLKRHALRLKPVPFFKKPHSEETGQIFGVREFVTKTYSMYKSNLEILLAANQVRTEMDRLALNSQIVMQRILGGVSGPASNPMSINKISDAELHLSEVCTEHDVRLAYTYLLGRLPESVTVVKSSLNRKKIEVVAAIASSEEYLFKKGKRESYPCSEHVVQECFKLFLGRAASHEELKSHLTVKKNVMELVDDLVAGDEFNALIARFRNAQS